MLRFAESNDCRMAAMVRHFGDLADSRNACGVCDFCAPDDCVGTALPRAGSARGRGGAESDRRAAWVRSRPTGKLHGELFSDGLISRDGFEDVLGALARSGLVRLSAATFEKDGQSIPYRKVVLTSAAEAIEDGETLKFQMKVAVESIGRNRKGKAKAKKAKKAKSPRPEKGAKAQKVAKREKKAVPSDLEQALRAWRLMEAKRRGVPAFRILADATLEAIAEARPSTAAELLAVTGIGLKSVQD